MTEADTAKVPRVLWNFFLGFIAALIAIAVGFLGAFVASAWFHAPAKA